MSTFGALPASSGPPALGNAASGKHRIDDEPDRAGFDLPESIYRVSSAIPSPDGLLPSRWDAVTTGGGTRRLHSPTAQSPPPTNGAGPNGIVLRAAGAARRAPRALTRSRGDRPGRPFPWTHRSGRASSALSLCHVAASGGDNRHAAHRRPGGSGSCGAAGRLRLRAARSHRSPGRSIHRRTAEGAAAHRARAALVPRGAPRCPRPGDGPYQRDRPATPYPADPERQQSNGGPSPTLREAAGVILERPIHPGHPTGADAEHRRRYGRIRCRSRTPAAARAESSAGLPAGSPAPASGTAGTGTHVRSYVRTLCSSMPTHPAPDPDNKPGRKRRTEPARPLGFRHHLPPWRVRRRDPHPAANRSSAKSARTSQPSWLSSTANPTTCTCWSTTHRRSARSRLVNSLKGRLIPAPASGIRRPDQPHQHRRTRVGAVLRRRILRRSPTGDRQGVHPWPETTDQVNASSRP